MDVEGAYYGIFAQAAPGFGAKGRSVGLVDGGWGGAHATMRGAGGDARSFST